MSNMELSKELYAHAQYLRQTYLPVGEKTAIERILSCASSLDKLAKEMVADETDHKQE